MKSLKLTTLCCLIFSCAAFSQIEGDYIKVKDFKAFGFGAFLNFAIPVNDANYVTIEGGLLYFNDNKTSEDVGMAPVLVGYRYTLDQSGTGFWLEPHVGYAFGATSIPVYDQYGGQAYDDNGNPLNLKIKGPAAGVGFGYLFQPSGQIQFNIGIRYDHTFGNTGTNLLSFRILHAFSLGRRNDY